MGSTDVEVWFCRTCDRKHRIDWYLTPLILPPCGGAAGMLPVVVPVSEEVAREGRARAGMVSLAEIRRQTTKGEVV